MPSLSIQIPDDLRGKLEARAAEAGHGTLEQYVEALIRADVEADIDPELEAELLKGLASPAREMTPADWEEMRRQLRDRHARAKGA